MDREALARLIASYSQPVQGGAWNLSPQQAQQTNPDINQEKDWLLDRWIDSLRDKPRPVPQPLPPDRQLSTMQRRFGY